MRKTASLFSPAERRIALIVLLGAGVLTLGMIALEGAFEPSLGLYGSNLSTPSLPNVIEARPAS